MSTSFHYAFFGDRYNMVGHCKFCITLLGGYVLFQEPVASKQLFGIFWTLSGIILYTYFKLTEDTKDEDRVKRKPLQSA